MNWKNLRVCVTRPQPLADRLCQSIVSLGAQAYSYPCIEIQSLVIGEKQVRRWDQLGPLDFIIVLSAHAVESWSCHWPNAKPQAVAIGPGTQRALEALGVQGSVCAWPHNSEGVLDLEQLKQIKGREVVILSGANPRPLISNELKSRGARVWSLYSYQRMPFPLNFEADWPILSEKGINVVIATSIDCIEAFVSVFKLRANHWLKSLICLAASDRIAQRCQKLNCFAKIKVATGASNSAILEALSTINDFK